MGKLILLILGLALYGAYALVEKATDAQLQLAAPQSVQPQASGGVAQVAMAVAETTFSATGLTLTQVDAKHCTSGALLSKENLENLYSALPAAQAQALRTTLAGLPASPVAIYASDKGQGLCLGKNHAVILPAGQAATWLETLGQLGTS